VASPASFQFGSVAELSARVSAERAGTPFLIFRDGDAVQQVVVLPDAGAPVPLGRDPASGIRLDWDAKVSRVHAVLEKVGGEWTLVDDGLSRNGTYVNGARLLARRRLVDGDLILCGSVTLQYRHPRAATLTETLNAPVPGAPSTRRITPAQRRVLIALCRPLADSAHGSPAMNKEIAARLHLSEDAVKTHLRRLSEIFEVDHLPQNQKRSELAWKALDEGVVTRHDLVTSAV
jgi:predicted component of type VI protein secretion system